jgi:hypothetical protein
MPSPETPSRLEPCQLDVHPARLADALKGEADLVTGVRNGRRASY